MKDKEKKRILEWLSDEPNNDIMTLQEATKYLKISEPTLRKLVKSGDIPGKKCGVQWRFSKKALEACMNTKDNSNDLRVG